jgi:hypothetical protein
MMLSGDNPVEALMTPRGKNPPRGKSAAKTPATPLLGTPSVPITTAADINSTPSKSAPSMGAPSGARPASHAKRISTPMGATPRGGSSMAGIPQVPQFQGGPQPSRTISGNRGKTASASSSFGSANRPGGRGGR